MNSLNLVCHNFITIHIRIQDEIFNEKNIHSFKINKIINIIHNISNLFFCKCLILSNNSHLKHYIQKFNFNSFLLVF